MQLVDMFTETRDSLQCKRVYAQPLDIDGMTVIPAAAVWGAAGGADGQDGPGGGFALTARATGAFLVKDGTVSWKPAVDVNRLVVILGLVALVGLFIGLRARRRRAREQESPLA